MMWVIGVHYVDKNTRKFGRKNELLLYGFVVRRVKSSCYSV